MEANRNNIPTVEELAREELRQEAREHVYGKYSDKLLEDLSKNMDKMSIRSYRILQKRIWEIEGLE